MNLGLVLQLSAMALGKRIAKPQLFPGYLGPDIPASYPLEHVILHENLRGNGSGCFYNNKLILGI